MLFKTPSGYVQPSPWLAIANKQDELTHKFMAKFGLSPAPQSRVSILPLLRANPWDDTSTPVWRSSLQR